MFDKPLLVGITGRAGSGKDTFAETFMENLRRDNIHVVKYSFADPLKESAKAAFGLSDGDVYTQEGKRLENPFWGSRLGPAFATNRAILQTWGTEILRKCVHDQFWLFRAEQFCLGIRGVVVIPDVRFDNEANWVLAQGGMLFETVNGNQTPVPSNKAYRKLLRLKHSVLRTAPPAWLHPSEDGLARRTPRTVVRSMSAEQTRNSASIAAAIFKVRHGL